MTLAEETSTLEHSFFKKSGKELEMSIISSYVHQTTNTILEMGGNTEISIVNDKRVELKIETRYTRGEVTIYLDSEVVVWCWEPKPDYKNRNYSNEREAMWYTKEELNPIGRSCFSGSYGVYKGCAFPPSATPENDQHVSSLREALKKTNKSVGGYIRAINEIMAN